MFWPSSCQSGRNFAAAHLLLKDGGELTFGEVLDDSLQACLESVLEQQEASQLRLHSPHEKKFILGDLANRAGSGLSLCL
jgi:hypothetical protein